MSTPGPTPQTPSAVLAGVARVVHLVTELPVEEVRPDRAFVEDLQVDSLAMVEILEGTAQHFGVRIEDEATRDLVRVRDLVDHVVGLT